MANVLVTGGTGFLAQHILRLLLDRGSRVVTTVRSERKGRELLKQYGNLNQKLDYVIVEDIAKDGAFDVAMKHPVDFDYVIHTASPFHFNVKDPVSDILNPAIKGTVGILASIKALAPSVKRVVITSSFAAMVNPFQHADMYDETNWNPITWEDAIKNPWETYRGSKTFAEKRAWEFVEEEKPNFDLTVINPAMTFGPILQQLKTEAEINTSNSRILSFIQGKAKDCLPTSDTFLWVDVRDAALAHVRAIEVPSAGNERFFLTAGYYSNKRIMDAIRTTHPELAPKLVREDVADDFPAEIYGFNNSKARTVLGLKFHTLSESVQDTVQSLLVSDGLWSEGN